MRRAADGGHSVLRIGAVEYCVWSPVLGASFFAELPFDGEPKSKLAAPRSGAFCFIHRSKEAARSA